MHVNVTFLMTILIDPLFNIVLGYVHEFIAPLVLCGDYILC